MMSSKSTSFAKTCQQRLQGDYRKHFLGGGFARRESERRCEKVQCKGGHGQGFDMFLAVKLGWVHGRGRGQFLSLTSVTLRVTYML